MSNKRKSFGAWLGLLAIALHAFVPLVGLAAYATPISSSGHQHAAAGHSTSHDPPGQRLDARHAHESAHEAPAAPNTFCVGDCPCCTSHYKVFLACTSAAWIVFQPSAVEASPTAAVAAVVYEPAHDHLARAPPFHS